MTDDEKKKLRNKERYARRRARLEADPVLMAAARAKATEYERARRERLRGDNPEPPPLRRREPGSPPLPRKHVYRPFPDIRKGPVLVSSPEDCDYTAAPSIPAPVHKIEPSLGPVPKRTGWKPSDMLQALLDASDADPNRLDKTICLQPDHVAAQEDKATWKHATTKEEREERLKMARKKYRDQRRQERIAMNGTPKRGKPAKTPLP